MKINKLKALFALLVNKFQVGDLNGQEFSALFHKCQLDYLDFLIGPVESFQPGRPVPRVGMGMGEAVGTKLSHFLQVDTKAIDDGAFKKPCDFYRLISMRDGNRDITRVEYNELTKAISSRIVPIANNPRFLEFAHTWTVVPASVSSIQLAYYRLPCEVAWNYVELDEREEFTESGSVDPEWSDVDNLHIIGRMIRSFGVVIKDSELMQYGESIKTTGE